MTQYRIVREKRHSIIGRRYVMERQGDERMAWEATNNLYGDQISFMFLGSAKRWIKERAENDLISSEVVWP